MTNFTVLAFFINTIKAVNDYEAFIESSNTTTVMIID
jgi:hypothetical protein